jgi:hypothetical protein
MSAATGGLIIVLVIGGLIGGYFAAVSVFNASYGLIVQHLKPNADDFWQNLVASGIAFIPTVIAFVAVMAGIAVVCWLVNFEVEKKNYRRRI